MAVVYTFCLLLVLPLLVLTAGPASWISAIPNNSSGNPPVSEYQTLTNIPGSWNNVLFSGVTYNGTTFDLPDTWILDSSGLTWKLATPDALPPARGYAVAGATADQLILFGGHDEKSVFFDDIWRFDVAKGSWAQDPHNVPSTFIKRSYAAAVLVVDTLYIFGGFVPALQATGNDLWSYNITSRAWQLPSPQGRVGAPPARQGHSAVFYNDTTNGPSIIIFGGYTGLGGFSDTWQYVIGSNTWIQLTKNGDPIGPSPRWGQSAVLVSTAVGSEIIIFGGSFAGGPVNPYYNDVWKLSLATGTTQWTWNMLLPDGNEVGPWRRAGHSSVLSNGRLYVFGGYGMYIGLYNDLWELINF
jgi:N-acetylneuraminic acid mutarotase